MAGEKTRVAVHKFSSCDGCQLAFLNMGEALLTLFEQVDIVHFAEAGPVDPTAVVDISFVEGSLSTAADLQRIRAIRANSGFLVTIGACATAGGLQALRNVADQDDWVASVYATPDTISLLDKVTPINAQVKVDLEIHGCPVNTRQLTAALRSLLAGVTPVDEQDKLCLECKRRHHVCVMVTQGMPCMGPVTRTGCGALCPGVGRDCYGCYGAAENVNVSSLGGHFSTLQLDPAQTSHRLVSFNSADPAFSPGLAAGVKQND
ncbi:MAG TPA: sulfhydrogenase subunit delta [Gammaproteobacteria bacterium]|nr:sulfhydrogenase subunit delta [Gammaproteobacteria bacterium]